jgi:hypothetical protein
MISDSSMFTGHVSPAIHETRSSIILLQCLLASNAAASRTATDASHLPDGAGEALLWKSHGYLT